MAKHQKKEWVRGRAAVQLFVAAATNSYVTGFAAGKIYQGDLKRLCHPGLNCYSCPGALLSCPIGALQAVIGSRAFSLSLYLFGFLLLVGATLGRFVCGFLCPFGFIQELMHKIPFPIKRKRFRGDWPLRRLKYVVLLVFVILLPMFLNNEAGEASPYFCKLVCPAGSLEAGIPLVYFSPASAETAANAPALPPAGLPQLPGVKLIPKEAGPRYQTGALFALKMSILVVTLLSCLVIHRPFCKYICPLGAVYGVLNPVSLYRLRYDRDKCIFCGACERACPMTLNPIKQNNHAECVRCGKCVNVCPTDALSLGFGNKKKEKLPDAFRKETL